MAANLYKGSMAYRYSGDTREIPWHKLGVQVPDGTTDTDTMINASGIGFETLSVPLYVPDGRGGFVAVDNRQAIIHGESRAVFGVPTDSYTILQHADAMRAFPSDTLWETMGALGAGEVAWGLARLGDDYQVAGDKRETIRPYVMIRNSHDGRSSVTAKDCATRVVCANTLAAAMSERAGTVFQIRHTASVQARMADAAAALMRVREQQSAEFAAFERMIQEPAGIVELQQVADIIAPVPTSPERGAAPKVVIAYERARERAQEDRGMLLRVWQQSPTMTAAKETKYGVYMAATEMLDHWQQRRGQNADSANGDWSMRRALYSLDGDGATQRSQVFRMLAGVS